MSREVGFRRAASAVIAPKIGIKNSTCALIRLLSRLVEDPKCRAKLEFGWPFPRQTHLKWPKEFNMRTNPDSSPTSRRPVVPNGTEIRTVVFAVHPPKMV